MSEENSKKTTNSKVAMVKTIAAFVAVLLVFAYFGYNFLLSSKSGNDLVTQTAVLQTIYKSVTADMCFIRQEQVLSHGASDNIISAVDDCAKVAGGDTVAYVLKSSEDAKLVARKAILEQEIKYYEGINSAGTASLIADINQDKRKIGESLDLYLGNICSGNIDDLYDSSKELREHLTKMQIDTGTVIDVSDKLEALRTEYNAIDSSEVGREQLTTGWSGYYFSFVDGYEGKVDYDSILSVTSEEVAAYLASQPSAVSPSAYGKVVTEYAWYAVCTVNQEDIPAVGIGSSITVCFPYIAADDIVMKVAAINKGSDGKTALVLRSTQMTNEIAAMRIEKTVLRVETYTGYRVENSAIRFVDGEQGVYVLLGNVINFRRITTVYQDDKISLAYNTDGVSDHLKLYDEIILEGTDLYDEKIIN